MQEEDALEEEPLSQEYEIELEDNDEIGTEKELTHLEEAKVSATEAIIAPV